MVSMLLTGCATINPPTVRPELNNSSKSKPKFFAETMSVANTNSDYRGRTDVHIIIPFSELIFKKTNNDAWQAVYNVEAQLLYQETEISYGHFTGKTPVYFDYPETKKPGTYSILTIRYVAMPNKYQLNLKVSNKSSRKTSFVSIPVNIRKIKSDNLDISDPLFIAENLRKTPLKSLMDVVNNRLQITPVNSQTLDPWNPINFIFEIYYPETLLDSLVNKKATIEYGLLLKDKMVFEKKLTYNYKVDGKVLPREIIGLQFLLPDEIDNGNYKFVLKAYINQDLHSYTVTKPIRLYSIIPRSEQEIKELFGPLGYVAPNSVVNKIEKVKTIQEKMDIFNAFWLEKGEDEEKEYYARVKYANEHFEYMGPGWKSDRGKTLIRFGPPDYEDNLPPSRTTSKQYKVWHYYYLPASDMDFYYQGSRVSHKLFIFVDDMGFGNYTFGFGELAWHNIEEWNDYDY